MEDAIIILNLTDEETEAQRLSDLPEPQEAGDDAAKPSQELKVQIPCWFLRHPASCRKASRARGGSIHWADAQIRYPCVDKVLSRWSEIEEDFSTKVFIPVAFITVVRMCVCLYVYTVDS